MPNSLLPQHSTKVPKIKVLRDAIDCGNLQERRAKLFRASLDIFRLGYKTESGTEGAKLVKWPEDCRDLERMASDYLDREGNGARYWPDTCEDTNLQYSTHRQR